MRTLPILGDQAFYANSAPVGSIVYANALPGNEYELANAYPSTPYLRANLPRLADASYGRFGKIIETSAYSPAQIKVVKIPGTEHYFSHGANNTTLSYRNGWNGSWSTVGSTGGTGRSGSGDTLLTRCVFYTDQANTVFVNGPSSFVTIAVQYKCVAEGNGRLIACRSGQLSYSANTTTPSFTDVALAGTWTRVVWCGGNNWVAIDGSTGDIAKSTDNGTTWTKYTSITGKFAPASFAYGWGSTTLFQYDAANDKFYIITGGSVYVATLATVTTAWTLESTLDGAATPVQIFLNKYGTLFQTTTDIWTCKAGTTNWRKAVTVTAGNFPAFNDTSDGYLVLDTGQFGGGSSGTIRMANGVDTFDPPRDTTPADLKPYVRLK